MSRVAGFAVLLAFLTAGAAALVTPAPVVRVAALAYVVSAMAAGAAPAAVTVLVVAGLAVTGGLLLLPAGPGPVFLALTLASVVASAELLALNARASGGPAGIRGPDVRRAAASAVATVPIFLFVAWAARSGGGGGAGAVMVAAAACGLIAVLLVRGAPGGIEGPVITRKGPTGDRQGPS